MARGEARQRLAAGFGNKTQALTEQMTRSARQTTHFVQALQGRPTLRHDAVEPDPDQPRKVFHREDLDALKQSILAKGVLDPIRVYPAERSGRYRIKDGERRWRAVGELIEEGYLGTETPLPVLFDRAPERSANGTAETRSYQLATSIHKQRFSALEQAAAILEMAELEGIDPSAATELAEANGFDRSMTERHLRVARGLSGEERTLLQEQFPRVKLDPLLKLIGWLDGQAPALEEAARAEVIRAFAQKKPPAKLLDVVLRGYAQKKPAGRPKEGKFSLSRLKGGGLRLTLEIPANRAADAASLRMGREKLERALTEIKQMEAGLPGGPEAA